MPVTIVDWGTDMNVEALRQAIRVLNEVEADARPLNMGSWVKHPCIGPALLLPWKLDCGTASCAAGWCARDSWFNERGFSLGVQMMEPVLMDGIGIVATGWRACSLMFGLFGDQTIFVFSPEAYQGIHQITPRHVISRIETLIEGNATTKPANHQRLLEPA